MMEPPLFVGAVKKALNSALPDPMLVKTGASGTVADGVTCPSRAALPAS